MQNKPTYGIQSVDHALRLAAVLQQEGPLRVSDAAERLGVARSTAHRLLAMLVYRDFAEQDEDRRYVAGPVLRRPGAPEPVADLRRAALPHLQELTERTDETTNLLVVVGDEARFVASVECDQVLRVGDRGGRVLPAHLASGGRAVLATRDEAEVRALYPDHGPVDVDALLRDLRRTRRQGFALNDQRTETGVTAIGAAVPSPGTGTAVSGAISISMPTARYRRARLPEWAGLLGDTARRIAQDL
ncbi:IclR family transcriptional regulator [Actinomycetospora flava]|uniref:IclR family transcriptional regulator n=1 Tax=Actinomycetospora flava TaxID=3129232 RepID=A0ABU8MAZ1_9PSEU